MSVDKFDRGETFLSRWSRRKKAEPDLRVREDERVREEVAKARGETAPAPAPAPPSVPADLPPIESLTPASDFSRFMRADVPVSSRNAAVKKLFTDPHFNVMDGLDIYIDDYTREDPIPLAMLKSLAQSRMLGLFDEDEKPVAAPPGVVTGIDGGVLAIDECATDAAPPALDDVPGESPVAPSGKVESAERPRDEPQRG